MRRGFRVSHWGCLVFVVTWMMGASADAHAAGRHPAAAADQRATSDSGPAACMIESYAYLRVAMVAQEMAPYNGVFSDALADLCDQLADCLSASDAAGADPLADDDASTAANR